MRLIFIYGPPAVGKLTVARELGRITGLAVFDNHLSVDAVRPVFGFGSPQLMPLVEKIRHLVIGEAARQGVSLIFTFVYLHPDDDDYVQRICDLVEGEGGSVAFVQLVCDPAVQEERVVSASRAGRKIDNVEHLREWSEGRDFRTAMPGRGSLVVDTTDVSAGEAARRIAEGLGIPVGGSPPSDGAELAHDEDPSLRSG